MTRENLGGTNAGQNDAFVAGYDGAGNQLWIRQFGTAQQDWAIAVAADGAGGAMVAGYTSGSLGGLNAGSDDAFVARFDNQGNPLWTRQFGTNRRELTFAIAPVGAGEFVVAGSTLGSLGGPNAGLNDAWVTRYDIQGNQLAIQQFGTSGDDYAYAVVSDGAGGTMIAGETRGNLGGTQVGSGDAYLLRLDPQANPLWIDQFGSAGTDFIRTIALDGAGGVMVGGTAGGDLGGPNAGSFDAFVAHYAIDFCYADCDKSTGPGVLDLFDFLCFQNSFVNAEPYACDCDTSTGPGVCDVFDFLCFQNAFITGCP